MGETDHAERLRNAALAVIALGVILTGLIYGRSFLIPLAIAILLWNLLEAVIERFTRVRIGEFPLPRWLAALLGIVVVVLGLYVIQSILLGQIDAVGSAWPRYMSRLESIVGDLTGWLGAEQSAKLKQAIMGIDLTRRIAGVVSSAQFFFVSLLLIIAYVGFLFVESAHMRQKIAAMFPDETCARSSTRSALFVVLVLSLIAIQIAVGSASVLWLCVRLQRKRHMKHAAIPLQTHREATAAKYSKHGLIFSKHLRLEPRHASVTSDPREMAQNDGCDAETAVVAVGHEGDLGLTRAGILGRITSSADQRLAILRLYGNHQGDNVAEIDLGQLLEIALRQFLLGSEKAPVN